MFRRRPQCASYEVQSKVPPGTFVPYIRDKQRDYCSSHEYYLWHDHRSSLLNIRSYIISSASLSFPKALIDNPEDQIYDI